MKKLMVLVVMSIFLVIGTIAYGFSTSTTPDGTVIMNYTNSDLNSSYHGQIVMPTSGGDYITVMDSNGNVAAWGYIAYSEDYSHSYLYVSTDGHDYEYWGQWN